MPPWPYFGYLGQLSDLSWSGPALDEWFPMTNCRACKACTDLVRRRSAADNSSECCCFRRVTSAAISACINCACWDAFTSSSCTTSYLCNIIQHPVAETAIRILKGSLLTLKMESNSAVFSVASLHASLARLRLGAYDSKGR